MRHRLRRRRAESPCDVDDANDVLRRRQWLTVDRQLEPRRIGRERHRRGQRDHVPVRLVRQSGRIDDQQMDAVPDVRRGLPEHGDDERSARRSARRRNERMEVRVVMEVHPPRQGARRQRPRLRVRARTRVVDRVSALVGRPGRRRCDRSRRRLVRGHRQGCLRARGEGRRRIRRSRRCIGKPVAVVAQANRRDRVGRQSSPPRCPRRSSATGTSAAARPKPPQ